MTFVMDPSHSAFESEKAITQKERRSSKPRLSRDSKEDVDGSEHRPTTPDSPKPGAQAEHDSLHGGSQGSQELEGSSLSTPDHRFQMPLVREVPFIIIICSTNILAQAGLGMTVVPLDIIGKSFGTLSPGQLSWFVAAFSLTVGTFILVAGRLGDMYVFSKSYPLHRVRLFFTYAIANLES